MTAYQIIEGLIVFAAVGYCALRVVQRYTPQKMKATAGGGTATTPSAGSCSDCGSKPTCGKPR